jgi:hypothetical protein
MCDNRVGALSYTRVPSLFTAHPKLKATGFAVICAARTPDRQPHHGATARHDQLPSRCAYRAGEHPGVLAMASVGSSSTFCIDHASRFVRVMAYQRKQSATAFLGAAIV